MSEFHLTDCSVNRCILTHKGLLSLELTACSRNCGVTIDKQSNCRYRIFCKIWRQLGVDSHSATFVARNTQSSCATKLVRLNTQHLVAQLSRRGCRRNRFTGDFGTNSPAQPVSHLTALREAFNEGGRREPIPDAEYLLVYRVPTLRLTKRQREAKLYVTGTATTLEL